MAEFNWYPLSSGASSLVDCIIKHDTDLYVGGMFSTVGGIATTGIAKWNGTEWNSVDGGVGYVQQILSGNVYPRVRSIAIYNDEIFIGGLFNRAGGQVVSNVAKLEKDSDGNYKFVSIQGFDEQVFKLKVIDGELYAGGSFFNITNSSGITVRSLSIGHRGFAKWNPTSNEWEETTIPTNGTVTDVVKFQDELYLTYGGTVCAVYNNKLYVGGNFDFWEGNAITNLAVTSDKITWSSVGGGFSDYNVRSSGSQFDTTVESLFVYEESLYVGGVFNRVGSTNHVLGLPVCSIAKWNESDWSSLGTRNTTPAIRTIFGVDEETTENQLGSLNKGLYVGGAFPAVPGTLANNIALYTDSFASTSVIGNEGVPCKPIFPCGFTRKQPIKSADAVLIPGPQGPPGPEGPQGPPGLDGLPGQDGSGRDCIIYAGNLVGDATNPLNTSQWFGNQYRPLPTINGSVDTSQLSDCDCFMDFTNRKIYFYSEEGGTPSFGTGVLFDIQGDGGGGIDDCDDVLECIPCLISSDIAEFNYPKDAQNNKTFTIQTLSGCNITNAVALDDWIVNVSHNSVKTITFSITENTTSEDRIGFIDFTVSNGTSSVQGSIIIKQKTDKVSFKKIFARITGRDEDLILDNTTRVARWVYRWIPVRLEEQDGEWIDNITDPNIPIIDGNLAILKCRNMFEVVNSDITASGVPIEIDNQVTPNIVYIGGTEKRFTLNPIPIGTICEITLQIYPLLDYTDDKKNWISVPNTITGTCCSVE